jgi:AcrR family transcriptional regulator
MDDGQLVQLPLRERKRLAAMHRIQTVALELFEAEGFDAVTVEHIADVAEVSPSSIYRWFGTKESIVIWDEFDPQTVAAIDAAMTTAAGPLDALRQVVKAILAALEGDQDRVRRRTELAFANPTVEAASIRETYEMANLIAAVLRAHVGEDIDDLDLQVFAHAFVGALLGGLRHWHDSGYTTSLDRVIETPLRILERGAGLR